MSDVLSETQDEAAYLRCQVQLLTDEVERLRLNQEEREAVRFCAVVLDLGERPDCAATLRGLLERIK